MEKRFKAGYVNPETGLVFCYYSKRLKSGEYWTTQDHYQKIVENKKKKHADRWANDLEYKKSILNRSRLEKYKNQDKIRKSKIEYKQKRKHYIKSWAAKKSEIDNLFVLKRRIRGRLGWAFRQKKSYKTQKSEKYIGAKWDTCMKFIESQFKNGMNWENRDMWHIDHFFPIAIAQSSNQLKQFLHFTNLRPMWAIDNIKKSCSVPSINEIIQRDEFVTSWMKTTYSLV
jgi:hypothetical protein